MNCPICKSRESETILVRNAIPTLQNRVYETRAMAEAAQMGRLELSYCEGCSFGFNRTFEPSLLSYDGNYDNLVASPTFDAYYLSIGEELNRRFDINGKHILDIGCGDGRFLRTLHNAGWDFTAIGIDPAYQEAEPLPDGIEILAELFSPDLLEKKPDLLICRHTLEHIPDPLNFVKMICEGLTSRGWSVPVLFEVPDLTWIIKNRCFWDFLYEHCNYFTPQALAGVLGEAGITVNDVVPAFGDQYLWAFGELGVKSTVSHLNLTDGVDSNDLHAYAQWEIQHLEELGSRARKISHDHTLVIWGMASKGVLFTAALADCGIQPDFCIDRNTSKQNRYLPGGRLQIQPPSALMNQSDLAIVCMNPNYKDEIWSECQKLGVTGYTLNPHLEAQ